MHAQLRLLDRLSAHALSGGYPRQEDDKPLLAHRAAKLPAGLPGFGLVPRHAGNSLSIGIDVARGGRRIGAGATDLEKSDGQEKKKTTQANHTSS